jgi:hypothetical protein
MLAANVRVEAQPFETSGTNTDSMQFSAEAISHREEELRRKEAELLRAINSGTSLPVEVERVAPPSSEAAITDHIKVSAPIQAPTEAVTKADKSASTVEVEATPKASQPPQLNALHEVENHPALESKKSLGAPAPVQRVNVGHREPRSRSRKPDTFRRVDREGSEMDSTPRAFTNSRTVSLQEIEAERDRPAPYQYEAIATIAHKDTTLRTGPRSADRALGSAPRFSEVSIDYRTGDWYRVQTSSGLRGWIQGRNLLFDAGISYRSAVRIGAVKREPTDRLSYRR